MDKTQRRLFVLAALFVGFYALALTLSPAARARAWDVDYRIGHWLGYAIWLVGFALAMRETPRRLPKSDPLLLPLIALLSGWGLLTIWRLTFTYGLRQTIWLAVALGALIAGLRLKNLLDVLQHYKYIWLTSGLILTALTLFFGTNPLGYGPRLWLGCCGVYLQPSEPLKLLLIVYLAAYLADNRLKVGKLKVESSPPNLQPSTFNILTPTLIMTGLALLLLIVQRDLGTASLFIFIYSVMIFLATGWRWIPVLSTLGLGFAGVAGYLLFDVVRLRVDAWINPWLDPSGRSYQIVQSLIAVANGGLFGRGPGMGNPSVVPVAHSDFVFAAIAEETGLLGTLGLFVLLGLIVQRGLRIARTASDPFRHYLAAGLTAYIAAQGILIIGGNLRLLPLTGVTLPFVSYGGSSLLTSFIALLILLHISVPVEGYRMKVESSPSTFNLQLSTLLFSAIAAAALVNGWWGFVRGPDLLTRTDNPRRAIADLTVPRGALLDRNNTPLVETDGQAGGYARRVHTPELGSLLGYSHPVYGQAGLEATLDPYLRGQTGNDPLTIWWHHLLYGAPPPGLDIRLTLDLNLQNTADELLGDHSGALILLDAQNGDILALASHPGYDPNQLDELWDALIEDERAPLLNRATQGSYPTGNLGLVLFPEGLPAAWLEYVPLRLPGDDTALTAESASPMSIALLAAALSNDGLQPVPKIAQAYQHPENGWSLLPALGTARHYPTLADAVSFAAEGEQTWHISLAPAGEELIWYLGGTLPAAEGKALAVVVVLEERNLALAEAISTAMLHAAQTP
ncbi:MAG: FtsW/RodA/SpoVE family cell cycle protein [Chloroflexi bacterium]|jgi:cell division protein FtsW (lipid II flippase)|nr:FtsW/RodA/SpoVE family cell cycle protein [Chloroflexota bacterium]